MNKINCKQQLIFMPIFLIIAADKLKIVLTKQLSQSFLCYMSVFFAILFASYFFRNDKPSTGFVAGGGLDVSLRESVARGRRFYQSFSNSCSWRWRISILSCSFSSGKKAIPRGFSSFAAVIRACLDFVLSISSDTIARVSSFRFST